MTTKKSGTVTIPEMEIYMMNQAEILERVTKELGVPKGTPVDIFTNRDIDFRSVSIRVEWYEDPMEADYQSFLTDQSLNLGIPEKGLEQIGRTCHEANIVLQIEMGDTISDVWAKASFEDRLSTLNGVVRAISGETPQELHQSWYNFKKDQGWVFGYVKDPEKKEHPCMVPSYEDLPSEQQIKDLMFQSIVASFLPYRGEEG